MTFPGARRVAMAGGSVNAPSRLIQTPGFVLLNVSRRPRLDWTKNRHDSEMTEIDPPHLLPTSHHACALNWRLLTMYRSYTIGSARESFALDAGASVAAIGGGARAVSLRQDRQCELARPCQPHMAGTVKSS